MAKRTKKKRARKSDDPRAFEYDQHLEQLIVAQLRGRRIERKTPQEAFALGFMAGIAHCEPTLAGGEPRHPYAALKAVQLKLDKFARLETFFEGVEKCMDNVQIALNTISIGANELASIAKDLASGDE